MPSAVVEQIRAAFLASMGLTENTPIRPEDEEALQDRWEQYLYASAQAGGGYSPYQPAPPPLTFQRPATYVPPADRAKYQPGQFYTIGGATYVGPPKAGSVYKAPQVYTGGSGQQTQPKAATRAPQATGGGTYQGPPPAR